MNPLDHSLKRLLNAAARAPAESPGSGPSWAVEAATLAEWRSAATTDEWARLAGLFRKAAICSGLIMLLSVGWGWFQSRSQTTDAAELANYAMTIQLPP